MKKVNGKQKGNAFERKISNAFSARFSEYTGLETSFRRNADSGSFFGGSNQKRIETHDLDTANFGDIITPKNFKFSIECKNYKTPPSFKSIVKQEVTQWNDWLNQALQDATNSSKEVLIVVKYNNVEEAVFVKEFPLVNSVILKYKEYSLVKLSDLLLMDNNYFFDDN